MASVFQATPPPGASVEGVDRGRSGWVLYGFIIEKTPQIPSVSVFCNPPTVEPTHTFQEQLIVVKNRFLAAQNKNRISQ